MLIDLERAVHVPLHLGADRGEPDAVGGPAQTREGTAQDPADDSVAALLAALSAESEPRRRSDWMERDRALILTGLLAGCVPIKCCALTSVTFRHTDDGAVIYGRGKSGKDRRIPIESALVALLEHYLDSRITDSPPRAAKIACAAWVACRRRSGPLTP